ncbi:MAG TPA: response regulator [Nocardioides sp.]|uniref:response regulator n=1 Tax=Nocardioides sp. TaxID=35761 RepID=UPI002F421AEF
MNAIPVLVVDDDFRVADVHRAMVERVSGFEVVGTAHTATEARTMSERLRPELVLMDIYLPDGSGLDVVRDMRAQPDPPSVIVISAARDADSIRQAVQLGAVHFLIKPFGFHALAERLTSYQQMRSHLTGIGAEAHQVDVDRLFGSLRVVPGPGLPPKGHSAPTLERVLEAVRTSEGDVSGSEVAEAIGISRATAQRYLNYLEQQGLVRLQLKYGTTGRPEHRYLAV